MSFDIKPVNNTAPMPKHKSSVQLFNDALLGEWKYDKKGSSGDTLWWVRTAEVNLAEVYAQDYIDPATMKPMKIFGEIKLVQKKAIDKNSSSPSMFNTIEPTAKSIMKEVII
jgi:hypothetical protein